MMFCFLKVVILWFNGSWGQGSARSGYDGTVIFCLGVSFHSLCDNSLLNVIGKWLNQAQILGPPSLTSMKDERRKHRHSTSTRITSNEGIIYGNEHGNGSLSVMYPTREGRQYMWLWQNIALLCGLSFSEF